MAANKLNIVTDPNTRTITIRGGSAKMRTTQRDGHDGIEYDWTDKVPGEFIPFPGMQLNAVRGPDFGVQSAA